MEIVPEGTTLYSPSLISSHACPLPIIFDANKGSIDALDHS